MNLKGRSFLTLLDFTPAEITYLLDLAAELKAKGMEVAAVLADNDAYHALKAVDGLIVTGPTGTNVNDVAVALLG